jgi:phage gp29-like protein
MASEPNLYNSRIATWRQQLNPLVGLSMPRVVQYLANSEMGYHADLQWLYLFIERRDAVLKAVIERRLSAMKKLSHTIKVKDGMEGKQADAQKEFLKGVYAGIGNLRQAIEFMATASFRGYAHMEKHYSGNGDVVRLEPVPQYLWCHKLPSKDWLYNGKAFQTATGVPIADRMQDFVVREIERPIDEIAVIHFIRKSLSQKDFDGFIEDFGIPPLFVELPPGVGTGVTPHQPGSEILDYYQLLAEQVISDARGVLPNGAKIQMPTIAARDGTIFEKHLRYQDEQIVLAGTSGLLTTLSAPTGLGGDGQGQQHGDAFTDLAKAEAISIAEIFQEQIDAVALQEEFPDQDILVQFDLQHVDADNDDPIDDATRLATAGYLIDLEQMEEETGYKLTMKPQPGVMGGGFGGAPAPDPSVDPNGDPNADPYSSDNDPYSSWTQNDQQSFTNRAQRVADSDDATIRNRLADLERELVAK